MSKKASNVRILDVGSTPIPKARRTILHSGQNIIDNFGDIWIVRESRATNHNFELYLGRPLEASGPMGAAVILTSELVKHLSAHRHNPKNLDLPIGETTIKRLRSTLGFNRYQDLEIWWLERVVDLERLTIADFAARHKVSAGAISQAHKALVGGKQRPFGWWRSPDMLKLLHSKMPAAWVAEQMGISTSSVSRLRLKSR